MKRLIPPRVKTLACALGACVALAAAVIGIPLGIIRALMPLPFAAMWEVLLLTPFALVTVVGLLALTRALEVFIAGEEHASLAVGRGLLRAIGPCRGNIQRVEGHISAGHPP